MRPRTCRTAPGARLAVWAANAAAVLLALSGAPRGLPGVGRLAGPLAAQEPPAAVPTYTNDDLDRVRPHRAETGVASEPAFAPGGADGGGDGRSGDEDASKDTAGGRGARAEAYWRREARRVREKVRGWRERLDELKLRISERRSKPGVRPYTDPQIVAWQRRVDALEARIRELEGDLDDRARRERALPGWLR